MVKKIMYFSILSFFVGIVFISPAFSQNFTVEECVSFATGRHRVGSTWTETKGGTKYSCRCDSRQGTVCTPISSGLSPSVPSGRLSPSQQMAAGIMGEFFRGLFSSDDLFAPPDTSYQDALREQEAKELLKQQEKKKQAIERWLNLQAEAEANRLKEEAERKRKGEEILAKTSIGGGLKMEPRRKLTPFSWDTPRVLAPAPSGQYDTSKFTEMERLLCAAYFSKMGENAANSGDIEGSRFYGTQMDNVMQGYPTAIECKPPKDISTTADVKKIGELNQKYTKMATVYKEIMPKIEQLQEIEIKLEEGKKKREDAEQKILELDKQIEEIKARSQAADTPEQKTQEDDLLAQALALKSEAEKQHQEALESEEKLIKEKQGIEEELNKMKDKIQAGGQR